MVQGLFDVSIDTPKYHRRGTLTLKSSGEDLVASLSIDGIDDLVFTGTVSDKEFDFEGNGDLPSLGQVGYRAHGSVWGNSITITCETDAGKVEVFGTCLSTEAGDSSSSHSYIMNASTGNVSAEDRAMFSGRYADGG